MDHVSARVCGRCHHGSARRAGTAGHATWHLAIPVDRAARAFSPGSMSGKRSMGRGRQALVQPPPHNRESGHDLCRVLTDRGPRQSAMRLRSNLHLWFIPSTLSSCTHFSAFSLSIALESPSLVPASSRGAPSHSRTSRHRLLRARRSEAQHAIERDPVLASELAVGAPMRSRRRHRQRANGALGADDAALGT